MIAIIVECVSKGNVIVHEQVMAGSLAGVSSHVHRPITNLHFRARHKHKLKLELILLTEIIKLK